MTEAIVKFEYEIIERWPLPGDEWLGGWWTFLTYEGMDQPIALNHDICHKSAEEGIARTYRVWYQKRMLGRFMADVDLDPEHLDQTHICLVEIKAAHLYDVFLLMQGERWSPNGEARSIIERAGLSYTSMSVGDVVEMQDGGRQRFFRCDSYGFTEI